MQYDTIIKNGKLVIPKTGITEAAIAIKDGKISAILENDTPTDAKEFIDANGKHVLPGVIDPHVHWGYTTTLAEQVERESGSAAVGGVTTALNYQRVPSYTDEGISGSVNDANNTSVIDFSFQLCLMTDEHADNLDTAVRGWGISSFKLFMTERLETNPSGIRGLGPTIVTAPFTDGFFCDVLTKLATYKQVVASVHCENFEIVERLAPRVRDTGDKSLSAWNNARPHYTETEAIGRVLYFAELTGCPIYIVHVSVESAIAEIARFKQKNNTVYSETCPHYLALNVDSSLGSLGKVNPPLRTKQDNEALWQALSNGVIDTVGSDNAAIKMENKQDMWTGWPGFPGSAIILPMLLSEGVHKGRISLERVVEVASYNAARIFNLYPQKGTIAVGSDADLAIVDMNLEKTVSPSTLQSWADFSAYDGWKLKGWPVMTLVRGKAVMEDGRVVEKGGYGQFIKRNRFLGHSS